MGGTAIASVVVPSHDTNWGAARTIPDLGGGNGGRVELCRVMVNAAFTLDDGAVVVKPFPHAVAVYCAPVVGVTYRIAYGSGGAFREYTTAGGTDVVFGDTVQVSAIGPALTTASASASLCTGSPSSL